MTARDEVENSPAPEWGAWIAYHPDWSGMVLFRDELSALRYAVYHSMQVQFFTEGESIR